VLDARENEDGEQYVEKLHRDKEDAQRCPRSEPFHSERHAVVADKHRRMIVRPAIVKDKAGGDFPGSPVTLEHVFRLDGDKIASLLH